MNETPGLGTKIATEDGWIDQFVGWDGSDITASARDFDAIAGRRSRRWECAKGSWQPAGCMRTCSHPSGGGGCAVREWVAVFKRGLAIDNPLTC
jgi:hypothetical protein